MGGDARQSRPFLSQEFTVSGISTRQLATEQQRCMDRLIEFSYQTDGTVMIQKCLAGVDGGVPGGRIWKLDARQVILIH
ncbi:MAG: hypothetical protein AAB425_03500 [Bdellovibrionota bacterium]